MSKESSVQHYVSKMFIKRFKKDRTRLSHLDVDTLEIRNGKLRDSFGEKKLWSVDTEELIGIIETQIGSILKNFDSITIDKQPPHMCTIWKIEEPSEKDTVCRLALLQPLLIKDLKNHKKFEDDILKVINKTYKDSQYETYYVKLYEEHCNGKFVITDYLGQVALDVILPLVQKEMGLFVPGAQFTLNISLPHYVITGENEFFFVGSKQQLEAFLQRLRRPFLIYKDKDGKEYEVKKKQIDKFELTAFNLNEIKSQESKCDIGSYDKEYLEILKKELPNLLSMKVMWREKKNLGRS